MKHIKLFEEFLTEAAIEKAYDGSPQLTHWYKGNPSLEMPLNDLLEALRLHFKMSKKEFPTKKREFNKFKRGGGEVETPDGFTIYWSKSTPPTSYLTIERKDGDEKKLEYIKGVIDDILAEYSVPINQSVQNAWNRIPEDVKEVFESAWTPEIEAHQIMTVFDDNRIKFDYAGSRFDHRKLPRGFDYIPDSKTTNFSVKTPKRTILFKMHKTSTWTIVSW